jgi:hypothetical protein
MPLAAFPEHVCMKFNMRSRKMDSPLFRLPLFLDVHYKDAVPASTDQFRDMVGQVGRQQAHPNKQCFRKRL